MRVLALDLATKTGWALWDGARIESGVQDFSKQRGESNGMLFLKFNRWLDRVGISFLERGAGGLKWVPAELIVFEQAHHRGGAATEIAVGLMTRVLEFCARYGIEHAPIHSMTLKKWATGSGKADKQAMILAAAKKKYELGGVRTKMKVDSSFQFASGGGQVILDDNEADAILLLGYALEKFGGGTACNVRPVAEKPGSQTPQTTS